MLPAPANAPSSAPPPDPARLLDGYLAALAARGAGNSSFTSGAVAFLRRWPDPQQWAEQTAERAAEDVVLHPTADQLFDAVRTCAARL